MGRDDRGEHDGAEAPRRAHHIKMTVADLIDRYTEEIGAVKPFGKNKAAVLAALRIQLGDTRLPDRKSLASSVSLA